MTAAPLILLAAPPGEPADGPRAALAAAGFAVADTALGPATPDLAPVAAVVVHAGPSTLPAAGFTRRLRAELGDRILPVVWVAPSADAVAAGLDAGADVVLAGPIEPGVLVAQVRAAVRVGAQAAGLAERAAEARALNDRLQKAYRQAAADAKLIGLANRAALPRELPTAGGVRFGACHRPRAGGESGGCYDVAHVDADRVAFWAADAGGLVGLTVRLAARGGGPRPLTPGEVLDRVNRALIGLDLDPPPLVGMAYGLLDVGTGSVAVARAGLPPAVLLPAGGEPEPWAGPGPFLGAFDAEFPPREGALGPGDKLLLATASGADRVTGAAGRHRALAAQPLAEAVAAELAAATGEAVTVLAVERTGVRGASAP
jgi:sigma-B regulation protein RsbU (phosphoserine phosphatase)